MEKKDMALLIEEEDTLADMDEVLEQLAGHGHASGGFIKLDNVIDAKQGNVKELIFCKSEFFNIFLLYFNFLRFLDRLNKFLHCRSWVIGIHQSIGQSVFSIQWNRNQIVMDIGIYWLCN